MSKPKSAVRELPEEGSHNAVCKRVYDVGTQKSKNEKYQDRPLVIFFFELVDQSTKDNPVYITHRLTNIISNKSNLNKMLKSWLGIKDGKDFDLNDCLNKPAVVTIVHSEDGQYANIETVTAPTKGSKIGKGVMGTGSFFLDDTFDKEEFESAPEWVQNLAIESSEFEEVSTPKKAQKKVKK
jgi:hypothetical protein